jgi:hypothetical protein
MGSVNLAEMTLDASLTQPLLKIENIAITNPPFGDGFSSVLDSPKRGALPGINIIIAGWFSIPLHLHGTISVILIVHEFRNKLMTQKTANERVDVKNRNLLGVGQVAMGFELLVSALDLPPLFTLEVRARAIEVGVHQEWKICVIQGRLESANSRGLGQYRPIYLVGLGRSGTTILMRMLGEHPSIIVGNKYPLELCVSSYHASLARLASMFADYSHYTQADLFSDKPFVGANPFASLEYVERSELDEAGKGVANVLSAAAAKANDVWYNALAVKLGKTNAAYFLEKVVPGAQLVTDFNTYPNARGIVLVRELGDVFVSRMRFNSKRGQKGFGAAIARDENDWVELFINEARSLMCLHQAYVDRVVATISYEELMHEPARTLEHTLHALELESSAALLDKMIDAGKDKGGLFGQHTTSDEGHLDNLVGDKGQLLERIRSAIPEFYRHYRYD